MRPTMFAAAACGAYVLAVAALAAWGFGVGSTALILLAFALTLPTGALALVGYYLAYGLLALLPGEGAWVPATTTVLGILAPVTAALLNVLGTRLLLRRREPVDDDSRRGVPAC